MGTGYLNSKRIMSVEENFAIGLSASYVSTSHKSMKMLLSFLVVTVEIWIPWRQLALT